MKTEAEEEERDGKDIEKESERDTEKEERDAKEVERE